MLLEKQTASAANRPARSFADLCPTMLSLMGMKDQIPSTVQSYDWSQHFLQEKIHTPQETIQPYYYCVPSDPTSGKRGIRTSRYTYVVAFEKGKKTQTWLYDRKTIPISCTTLQTVSLHFATP